MTATRKKRTGSLRGPAGWSFDVGRDYASAGKYSDRSFVSIQSNGTCHLGRLSTGNYADVSHSITEQDLTRVLPVLCRALGVQIRDLRRSTLDEMQYLTLRPDDAALFRSQESDHKKQLLAVQEFLSRQQPRAPKKVVKRMKVAEKKAEEPLPSEELSGSFIEEVLDPSQAGRNKIDCYGVLADRSLASRLFPIVTGVRLRVQHDAGPWFGVELYPNTEGLLKKEWHPDKTGFLILFHSLTGTVGTGRFACSDADVPEYIRDVSIHPDFIQNKKWGWGPDGADYPEFQLYKVKWNGKRFEQFDTATEDYDAAWKEGTRVRKAFSPGVIYRIAEPVILSMKAALAEGT